MVSGVGSMKRWIVLNCHVTQILSWHEAEAEATAAAERWGDCSFPYYLSDDEVERVATA